jgi:hypothetical protein
MVFSRHFVMAQDYEHQTAMKHLPIRKTAAQFLVKMQWKTQENKSAKAGDRLWAALWTTHSALSTPAAEWPNAVNCVHKPGNA